MALSFCSQHATGRSLRPLGAQQPTVGRRSSVVSSDRLRLQPCPAQRYQGQYRGAADWAPLFNTLATEVGEILRANAREYAKSGDKYGAGQPIDVEPEDPTQSMWVPVDVEETAEGYSLYMDVPGLQKSDVKVQVFPEQRTITISGERKRSPPEEDRDSSGRAFRRRYERRIGRFSRTLRLAKDLDVKTISGRVDKGVLLITAKKLPANEPDANAMEINIE